MEKHETPALQALAQGLRRIAAQTSADTVRQETVAVAVALCGAERGDWVGPCSGPLHDLLHPARCL